MEREELLGSKNTGIRMKGMSDISSDESDEIEIFNRKRQGNQGKSCEVGGVLMVLMCLTFFATTIIFGARYMSAMKKIEQLEGQLLFRIQLGKHANTHPQIDPVTSTKLPDVSTPTIKPSSNVAENGTRTSEQFATNSSTQTLIRRVAVCLLSFTVILYFENFIA